ncbi:DNA-3-methyladenine glycosylase [Corynebacterium nuruki]|uniref:DNA-3-methyladenine glycosylase n=1 Tax=Corynebacterium nuruki TaxID=1032851 RepID=UPI0039BF4F04
MIDLSQAPETVAPQLLGAVLRRQSADGTVAVLLTEVEAYPGIGDPASHTANGWTPRCATMFGPPGHLYVYASYGIHRAGNIVCQDEGTGAGVLMRAGRVVEGLDLVRRRRSRVKDGAEVVPEDAALARGPGNLGAALGLDLDLDGATLAVVDGSAGSAGNAGSAGPAAFTLTPPAAPVEYVRGPRIGVSKNADAPLRFWIPGERSVTSPRRPPRG